MKLLPIGVFTNRMCRLEISAALKGFNMNSESEARQAAGPVLCLPPLLTDQASHCILVHTVNRDPLSLLSAGGGGDDG